MARAQLIDKFLIWCAIYRWWDLSGMAWKNRLFPLPDSSDCQPSVQRRRVGRIIATALGWSAYGIARFWWPRPRHSIAPGTWAYLGGVNCQSPQRYCPGIVTIIGGWALLVRNLKTLLEQPQSPATTAGPVPISYLPRLPRTAPMMTIQITLLAHPSRHPWQQ